MEPFSSYPQGGRSLLGRVTGANCRREYGLRFMKLTHLTKCAYCGMDFASSYEAWLNMALDHVLPVSVCNALGVPEEWREDYANRVLACAACNTFGNRYRLPPETPRPKTLDDFLSLRDDVLRDRRSLIQERHHQERAFFEQRPWAGREGDYHGRSRP